MKLGQTSFIYYLSSIGTSVIGFVATIYFARLLGAEPLGIYYLVIGIVSWIAITGKIGVAGAIAKRVSEGTEQAEHAIAGVIWVGSLFTIAAIAIVVFRPYVDTYVGYPATPFIIGILLVTLAFSIVFSLLKGLHLVHIQGLLSPTRTGVRALIQVGLLVLGFELVGLFLGYIAGYLVVIAIGLYIVLRNLGPINRPRRDHFRSLLNYAKYAWLGSLQSRMFNYTDIIVLGLFVPSALIGVYAIAWNIAQFFILFAGAISNTLFPEMSKKSTEQRPQAVGDLVEKALSYAGLLLIPGLIGGFLVGERVLRIYGDEFTQGATILVILIVANLVMSYQNQLLNTLNAIDRPELSFRVNAVFILANLILNLTLVYLYGWYGAAVATALSVSLSLILAYRYLRRVIAFTAPVGELTRQGVAGFAMGGLVYGGLYIEESFHILQHNFATVLILVGIGAGVYFVVYYGLSSQFRTTVHENSPVRIPLPR